MKQKGLPTDEAKEAQIAHAITEPRAPTPFKSVFTRITPVQLQNAMAAWPSLVIATAESDSFFNGYGMRDLSLINELWDGISQGTTGRPKIPQPIGNLCMGPAISVRAIHDGKGFKNEGIGSFR